MGDTRSSIEEVADAFGTSLDPLAEFEPTFERQNIDPFAPFIENVLNPQGLHEHTHRQYLTVFEEWTDHMAAEGRHPACPTDEHVLSYIDSQLSPDGADNHPRTVKGKLRKLNRPYQYWQDSAAFPHPQDYNPFTLARDKVNLESPKDKRHRRIAVSELREMVQTITHIRNRAIVCVQFKLGLRAGEVLNIQIQDIAIDNSEVRSHYPELGTARYLKDEANAIYVPPGFERPGNKSSRARMLPLDDELRRLLVRYLLIRPDNGEPWLFLSEASHDQMPGKAIYRVWKDAFHPAYGETEEYKAISSHFGRHRFSTWWRVEQDLNRELVQYMRGDKLGNDAREAIDTYLHTYYADVEDVYRADIYRLGI